MKKLMALMLCLSMVFGTVAFATETELNKDVLEGQTTVSLTIAPEANEFVVVIPASATIDPSTQEGTFDVVLKSGWKLVSVNSLAVRIKTFANAVNNASYPNAVYYFTLKNSEGSTARYTIRCKSAGSSDFGNVFDNNLNPWTSKNLISVSKSTSNEEDQTASLKLKVETLPTSPGEYTDVITFAVVLE